MKNGKLSFLLNLPLIIYLLKAPVDAQDLIISEVLAANNSGLLDEDGNSSDWVEIHNTSQEPLSLQGWHLTDDRNNLRKWLFPNITIKNRDFLIVFASGKNRSNSDKELHTNFKLERKGEYLALVKPDGITISSEFTPQFPEQFVDVSYGPQMNIEVHSYLVGKSKGKMNIPRNDSLAFDWIYPDFNDENWEPVTMPVGYFKISPETFDDADPVTTQPDSEEFLDPDLLLPTNDITKPGDGIIPTSTRSPVGETVENAIDNDPRTKYLNFDKLNSGMTVQPQAEQSVVTGLRLTSANDVPERDPASFILYGSNDGSEFSVISTGDIGIFPSRFFTQEVHFSNDQIFRFYRLIFPKIKNAASAVAMQIAEIEFIGKASHVNEDSVFMDVTNPNDVIIPSSPRSPSHETAENAIDDDPKTKYLNFDKLNTGFTVSTKENHSAVTALRLTSANDSPERDPASYIIYGSNNKKDFVKIAQGSIPIFPERFFTITLWFDNKLSYADYQILFPTIQNSNSAEAMQISEVELLTQKDSKMIRPNLQDLSEPNDLITPTSYNSPAGEWVEKAIDNDPSTKYLNFDKFNTGFTITPKIGQSVVTGLRLTSANDSPDRDPKSYILYGSNDNQNFIQIAQGSIPVFPKRFHTITLMFENVKSYTHYRLLFPKVRNPGFAVAMQIAEIEFLGLPGPSPLDFKDLILTNVEADMFGQTTTLDLRFPFTVKSDDPTDSLNLNVRYSDGFVAYLNGARVAHSNAPENPGFSSTSISERSRDKSLAWESFMINSDQIRKGSNLLAIRTLNYKADSLEFLFHARLENAKHNLGTAAYYGSPTPGFNNGEPGVGMVSIPRVDHEHGFYDTSFELFLSTITDESSIRYTTDGSQPALTTGKLYSTPIRIERTTILRATAFRTNWLPSKTLTQSYIFPEDTVRQTFFNAKNSGFPERWDNQTADYELDRRVTGLNGKDRYGGKYTRALKQSLQSLPSISIVMEIEDLFGPRGIYSNPERRGAVWERPASVEMIHPNKSKGFQENAGIRIQGGAFREMQSRLLTLKKSFRLIFRNKYGASRLDYPLFGPEVDGGFDNIVLRANGNDAWTFGGTKALYIRDAFAMKTAQDMGMVAPNSTFVHLYLNGLYWGLYNPVERPDAGFSAKYHGGNEEDWDALNQDSAPDGNHDAWNRMLNILNEDPFNNEVFQRLQGNNPDGTPNPELESLLNVENMIDYMILNFYVGNGDWPGRNHWVGRNRTNADGFYFYPWDTETALGLGSGLGTNRLNVNGAVATPYAALRGNPNFRLWFADRVHRHFSRGGALYVNPDNSQWNPTKPENNRPAARFAALVDQVKDAMVGESTRWGDQLKNSPFTPDEHWKPEKDDLLKNYFPNRSRIVLGQFQDGGLYPSVSPPVLGHLGGRVEDGFKLTIRAPKGEVFYTLDGTDPRDPKQIGELSRFKLVSSRTPKKVLVPSKANGGDTLGFIWLKQLSFNDAEWTPGTGGVGYSTHTKYQDLIEIDVVESMRRKNGSVFVRIPFDYRAEDVNPFNQMTLRVRYDDGFTAFLNGKQIASANAPDNLQWNSLATATNPNSSAVEFREFDVSQHTGVLRKGKNLLAVHGLNYSLGSSDFLIDIELTSRDRTAPEAVSGVVLYESPIILNDLTFVRARTLYDSQWSALTEAKFIAGNSSLTITELNYHPDRPSGEEIHAGFDNADDFEFIEFHNPGTSTLDLEGLQFSDGIQFNFTTSVIKQIKKGQYLLIVRNRAAFEKRYGLGLPIAGEYSGRLSNNGEPIQVVHGSGEIILEVNYGTKDPWPEAADGMGYSLEIVDPKKNMNQPENWRMSLLHGGSPGYPGNFKLLKIRHLDVQGNKLHMVLSAPVGKTYTVLFRESLSVGNWRSLEEIETIETEEEIEIQLDIPDGIDSGFFQIMSR